MTVATAPARAGTAVPAGKVFFFFFFVFYWGGGGENGNGRSGLLRRAGTAHRDR